MSDTNTKVKSSAQHKNSPQREPNNNNNILPLIPTNQSNNPSTPADKKPQRQNNLNVTPSDNQNWNILNKNPSLNNENFSHLSENMNQEDDNGEGLSINSQNMNWDVQQKEAEYIVQIEQWENELLIERQITKTIQRDPELEEEYEKCKEVLNEKQMKLKQWQTTNRKQKTAIDTLSKEIDIQVNKPKTSNNKRNTNTNPSNGKGSKENNPWDIILKVKDKELKNALVLMDTLSKNNEEMKKAIYVTGDYQSKQGWIDDMKTKEDKIAKLKKEAEILNKQWEPHRKCKIEQDNIWDNIKSVLEDWQKSKEKFSRLRLDFQQRQEQLKNGTNKAFSSINKTPKDEKQMIDTTSNNDNRNPQGEQDEMGVWNTNEIKELKREVSETTHNQDKNNWQIIPMKSQNTSPLQNRTGSAWMTREWKEKIKSLMTNEQEYQALIVKIEEWESMRTSTENKHRMENKKFKSKLNELEVDLDAIRGKNKENDSKNKVWVCQINELKNEQKINQRKWNENQNMIDSLQSTQKEKDQEIKWLLHQLNSLKKIVKHGTVDPLDAEVSKYINKLKLEEGVQSNFS